MRGISLLADRLRAGRLLHRAPTASRCAGADAQQASIER